MKSVIFNERYGMETATLTGIKQRDTRYEKCCGFIKRVVHDLTNGEHYISRKPDVLKLPMKAAAEEELSKINMILSSYSINKE